MKYSELERMLKEAGCYPLNQTRAGHPLWYSPITRHRFVMSHHGKNDVKPGTLSNILKDAGLK